MHFLIMKKELPKRESECATRWIEQNLSMIQSMNAEELAKALGDIWSDGYWTGHDSVKTAKTEMLFID